MKTKKILKHLPNTITLLNMLCGCISSYYAFNNQLPIAAFFVFLGIFFDFFDGFFARILNAASPIGLQLDSLADMITSGLVPGIFMFQLLQNSGLTTEIAFIGFLISLGSGYRLANFNIDPNQSDSFIGLPTPANALFIISLGLIASTTNSPEFITKALKEPIILIIITLLSTYILNAKLPLLALKFKTWDVKTNWKRYFTLIGSIISIAILGWAGIAVAILLYIGVSLLK